MGELVVQPVEMSTMHQGHYPGVMEIIAEVSDPKYDYESLQKLMSDPLVAGHVATNGKTFGDVLGFSMYYVQKDRLELLHLAVRRHRWRQRIGSQLMIKLKNTAMQIHRLKVEASLPDLNLGGQLFLRYCLFHAIQVLPDFDQNPPGELYVFRYRHDQPPDGRRPVHTNRFVDGDFSQQPLSF